MKATTIFNQSQIDAEVVALTREFDAKAAAAKADEKQRITDISALGKAHDLMNEANTAICDDITVEQFKNSCVIQKLEADKKALQQLVAEASRLPSRAALLSDPQAVRTDKLLDAFNEAKKSGDSKARYQAMKALQAARKEASE